MEWFTIWLLMLLFQVLLGNNQQGRFYPSIIKILVSTINEQAPSADAR